MHSAALSRTEGDDSATTPQTDPTYWSEVPASMVLPRFTQQFLDYVLVQKCSIPTLVKMVREQSVKDAAEQSVKGPAAFPIFEFDQVHRDYGRFYLYLCTTLVNVLRRDLANYAVRHGHGHDSVAEPTTPPALEMFVQLPELSEIRSATRFYHIVVSLVANASAAPEYTIPVELTADHRRVFAEVLQVGYKW
jgi:hypothetical protein